MAFVSTLEIDTLFRQYPHLFYDFTGGFTINDGWFPIVKHLCMILSSYVNEKNLSFSFLNVQNKFGTLYISNKGGDAFTAKAIQFAERLSYRTCEHCGEKGKLHSSNGTQFGKYATLCDKDALKILYKRL